MSDDSRWADGLLPLILSRKWRAVNRLTISTVVASGPVIAVCLSARLPDAAAHDKKGAIS